MIPKVRRGYAESDNTIILLYFVSLALTILYLVQREKSGFTEAPIGQPTAHPRLVDKTRPGGSHVAGADSTAAAYIKLGSLVVVSAAVTWFGVPLLASLSKRALEYV